MNTKLEVEKIYALSPMQEGMLFHSLMEDASNAYFEQNSFELGGSLNIPLFEESFNTIIQRHDVFRTLFIHEKTSTPQQVVLKKRPAKVKVEDISNLTSDKQDEFVKLFKEEDIQRGFKLSRDILIRMSIIKKSEHAHLIIWSFHHIVMDGWCMGIVTKELFEIYNALITRQTPNVGAVQPYVNYIKWLERQDRVEARQYWNEYLIDFMQPSFVPFMQPSNKSYEYQEHRFRIQQETIEALSKLAKRHQVTMNTVFQTIWGVFLQKSNNCNDIVFGTVISGRPPEIIGIENIVGLFINTVPVRIRSNASFADLLQVVQKDALWAEKYGYMSLSEIQANTELKQGLINHVFVFENQPIEQDIEQAEENNQLFGFQFSDLQVYERTNYDFSVMIIPGKDYIFRMGFNASLYEPGMVKRIERYITQLIQTVITNDTIAVEQIELVTAEEKAMIVSKFNNPVQEYDRRSIQQLFEHQAELTPDAIALEFESEKQMELWPSVAEYFIYDDLLYSAMTFDEHRNASYKTVINKYVKDKIVVDIGTGGDAILSRFSVEAGAKRVYAIEILESSYLKAKAVIERLHLQDKITLIHGDATKIELPEKADVCVSEIVGAIGGAEGSAVIINSAWRLLKEDGIMIPLRSKTMIAAISLPDEFIENIGFSHLAAEYTNKVFEHVGREFDLRVCIKNFDRQHLISNSSIFEDLDHSGKVDLETSDQIELLISKDTKIQGFLVWLNLYVSEDEVIDILDHEYCWLPVFVPVFYPGVHVSKGDRIIATCTRTLCENGLNPDFNLTGYLEKTSGECVPFNYDILQFGKQFRNTPLYQKVFRNEHKIEMCKQPKALNSITYSELNRKSNQIAHLLRQQGTKPGDLVGLLMERPQEMIVSILAVLKAGGAYLPIDASYYPEERIMNIIEDSTIKLLLTDESIIANNLSKKFISNVESMGSQVQLFKEVATEALVFLEENPVDINSPEDIAYVIYTSGTTGVPKGVMLKHKGVVNLTVSQNKSFGITSSSRVLQFASFSFDASVSEIFTALTSGATLYLPKRDKAFVYNLNTILRDKKINVVTLPPSVLKIISSENLPDLTSIISAGESYSKDLLTKWSKGRNFINAYGPTESTVCATISDSIDQGSRITIGKPMSNIQVYIIDKNLNLLPVGMAGEICIGGIGLAQGYLKRPELTEQRFIDNPFIAGEKLYRTGDMGRWMLDGEIEFLGRIDHQVKIRGFRIEIDEIKHHLLNHEMVKEVEIIDIVSNEDNQLYAFLVTNGDCIPTVLKEHLSNSLPDYMIPSHFVQVTSMPLTRNGKVDRAALQKFSERVNFNDEDDQPRNETEEILCGVWKEVLNRESVGVNEAFSDIGGHSLNAIQIVSKLKGLDITLRINSLFELQTIKNIATQFEKTEVTNQVQVENEQAAELMLENALGFKVKYTRSNVDGKTYYCVHSEYTDPTSVDRLKEMIKQNMAPTIYPHYICAMDTECVAEYKTEDAFGQALNLSSLDESEINDTISNMWKAHELFETQLMHNTVVSQQNVAPIQQYHLSTMDFSGTFLKISGMISIETINKAFYELLKKHDILRCTLSEEVHEGKWNMHAMPDSITLPYLDLSLYTESSKKKCMDTLIKEFYFKPYSLFNSFQYRVLLIKENMQEYSLLLPFAHAKFDFMSSEIIKKDLTTFINANDANKEVLPVQRKSYWDYVDQILDGPYEITDSQIVDLYHLSIFKEQAEKVAEYGKIQDFDRITKVEYEIDHSSTALPEDITGFLLSLTGVVMSRLSGLERIPVYVVNYGRSYMGTTYYDTIGEFIDTIPFVLDSNDNPDKVTTDIKERLQIAQQKNINFAGLIFNENLKQKFPDAGQLLQDIPDNLQIIFNFIGYTSEPYHHVEQMIEQNLEFAPHNRILFEAIRQEHTTVFKAIFPYRLDEALFKECVEAKLYNPIGRI
ncbi:non-ribosomal peptide synthetase [Paenibacillus sp. FSL H7-689]|uniref:non-ribosomal peptide synthetase n=1 Tax=Paenibacillus sp. FSL H7-689 TaxID=1227349 RepID=UPI0003E1C6B5|nr:non-ribosomal peptide synthetase [Paenibacillus sp. FSL H7-689]ETT55847.1 non-ribosomal peptide synthetase [Paenibacillus sp. FSL H7-689]